MIPVRAGVELARGAGFDARERVVKGKAWRVISDVADELDTGLIVLGARGLSRVQSALLGSVSAAVVQHARRPVLIVPRHVRAPAATYNEQPEDERAHAGDQA